MLQNIYEKYVNYKLKAMDATLNNTCSITLLKRPKQFDTEMSNINVSIVVTAAVNDNEQI